MVKSSSSSENEVFDDSFCFKYCRKNTDSLNTKITKLNEALSDSKTNLYHYKLGLSQVEARLVEFKTQEIKFCEKIRGLEFNVKVKNNKIDNIMNELEHVKKEKDGLDSKLTGFKSASKDLDTLLGSLRTDKNNEGLGYNAIPPSCLSLLTFKKDMTCTGLPEFVDDTITDYCRPSLSIESNSNNLQNNNSSVSKHEESSSTILSKRPTDTKTNKVESVKKSSGNTHNNIDDKGYWDSGCSRHMTGNISCLSNYEPYDGGYVSFGQGVGKITGKGIIRTGKLEFENVYFVKDLK
nr:ribonuclease H-like domain-containing protein [Tanacetum cinerariifolium]